MQAGKSLLGCHSEWVCRYRELFLSAAICVALFCCVDCHLLTVAFRDTRETLTHIFNESAILRYSFREKASQKSHPILSVHVTVHNT